MRGASPIDVELRHLRYFLAVFDELHFGHAAERLHIAQPPLSQAIRKLERELGVVLFQRTSRLVTPTEAGRVLAEHARQVFANVDLAIAEVRRAGGAGSTLRIGCVPNLSIDRLLRFLNALHASDPNSETRVTHLLALEQMERLGRGDLDLGVFYDAGVYDGIEFEPLFAGEPILAFLPLGHWLAGHTVLTPDDFANETLVTLPRSSNPALHDRFLDLLKHAGYRFRELREADGLNARDLLLAVAEGAGIGLCSASLNSESSSIVIRRPLDPPLSMPGIVVGWSTKLPRQPRAVLESLREIARQLREDKASREAD